MWLHLPHNRVLFPQSHNDDAVGLTYAALGPWGECGVCLIKDYTMNVLLLTQPAGQTILVDTRERICLLVADNKLISQYSVC